MGKIVVNEVDKIFIIMMFICVVWVIINNKIKLNI